MNTLQRFEKFFRKGESSACWEWFGGRIDKRYGSFGVGGRRNPRTLLAHRFSYEAYLGKIPDGLFVLHRCDNPLCVNPRHLFLGTQKDNLLDARSKGRLNPPRGEKHWKSKLKAKDVLKIRKIYRPRVFGCKRIAALYGVRHQTIWNIINQRSWLCV